MKKNSTKVYYENYAKDYFCLTSHANLQHLWKKFYKEIDSKSLILDIGCGSGRDVKYFASRGSQVIGLDFSFNLLNLAKSFSQQPLVNADLESFPFPNNVFDAVWAMASLIHITRQKISSVLSEIHRVLKPNAVLFTSIKKGNGKKIESDGRYFEFYQLDEWKNFLIYAGYSIKTINETVEVRQTKFGTNQRITWIESFARRL